MIAAALTKLLLQLRQNIRQPAAAFLLLWRVRPATRLTTIGLAATLRALQDLPQNIGKSAAASALLLPVM